MSDGPNEEILYKIPAVITKTRSINIQKPNTSGKPNRFRRLRHIRKEDDIVIDKNSGILQSKKCISHTFQFSISTLVTEKLSDLGLFQWERISLI